MSIGLRETKLRLLESQKENLIKILEEKISSANDIVDRISEFGDLQNQIHVVRNQMDELEKFEIEISVINYTINDLVD